MAQKSHRTNNEWVYANPSPIHGSGLFARTRIPAGTEIVEYTGPRLSIKEGKQLAEDGNVYVFRINRKEFLDGSVSWNLARHANHSCDPNAASVGIRGGIWLLSLRTIEKGEEITYDYGYSFREEPVPCLCKAPNCIGVIVATRHRDKL